MQRLSPEKEAAFLFWILPLWPKREVRRMQRMRASREKFGMHFGAQPGNAARDSVECGYFFRTLRV
jgi:hypothetical protein